MENRNTSIKLVTKTTNDYRSWERFRNRCMLDLEKGIDFEIDKDDGNVKMVEKKDPDNLKVSFSPNHFNRKGWYYVKKKDS